MAPISEADTIILNKANIALAKSQRLIASWLPPRSAKAPPPHAKAEAEIEKEEQELFTPVPELLGLGAVIPTDGQVKRQDMSANDKLRKQLLGKEHPRRHFKGGEKEGILGLSAAGVGSKPRPGPLKKQQKKEEGEDEDEDDVGRSSLGKRKRERRAEGEARGAEQEVESNGGVEATEGRLYRRQNYLDEVLAEKSRAKRKKNRKKEKRTNANQS